MSNQNYTLRELLSEEAYNASSLDGYAFRRGTDVRNGIVMSFGNMVSGYPFMLNGVPFYNSECAYITGAFSYGTPEHIALQQRLVACNNGFMAKKAISRPHENEKRGDWDSFKVEWMRYCVWSKCTGNADFRKLLLAVPDNAVIIEDSTFQHGATATLWGTRNAELKSQLNQCRKELKAQGISKASINRELDRKRLGEWSSVGVFRGCNVMGKILMECRNSLRNGTEPSIDYVLLREKNINLLGRVLIFGMAQAA